MQGITHLPSSGRSDESHEKYEISVADRSERRIVRRLRHRVYAEELHQYQVTETGELTDKLDSFNIVLLAKLHGEVCGFVSITPPRSPSLSVDKYFSRAELPFKIDDSVFEIRVLTVDQSRRRREAAALMLYGAFRWVESHGGSKIVAIGRQEVLSLYLKIGMREQGLTAQAGAVSYSLLLGDVEELRASSDKFKRLIDHLEKICVWKLPFAFSRPSSCFHGGAFFKAIGERFDHIERSDWVINADVLDAWYPPSPLVLSALSERLDWLIRTSPPTDCRGLIEVIAETRGLNPQCILPGAGSSDLIFRCTREWLDSSSRALILSPTYGEYEHILERVIGCKVDRFALSEATGFNLDPHEWLGAIFDHSYDLVVLVNPNSPTGQYVRREVLEELLPRISGQTKVWIDETYIEYCEPGQSMEVIASQSENVIVCKSMSKIYALSGMRVAYLCAGAHILESIRAVTPPWVVGLMAQVAAVAALQDPAYYVRRVEQTRFLRDSFSADLTALGFTVLPSVANFLLCKLPANRLTVGALISACQAKGLFLRDPSLPSLCKDGGRAVRIAVKDDGTNRRIIEILKCVLNESSR